MLEKQNKTGSLLHWWECKMGRATLENGLAISYTIQHTTALSPNKGTLGHFPREIKPMCTQTPQVNIVTALFPVAGTGNNQMSFTGWMSNHGTPTPGNTTQPLKRDELIHTQCRWIMREIILREKSKFQKVTNCTHPCRQHSGNDKIPEVENGRLAAQGQNCSHKRGREGLLVRGPICVMTISMSLWVTIL